MYVRCFLVVAAWLFVSGSASAATDPCKLVTQSEASAALGVAAQAGIAKTGLYGPACRYYNADHTKNVYVALLNESASSMTVLHPKPISGFPGEAYWMSGSIFFFKGDQGLQVGLYLSSSSMSKMDPALVPLAKTAASRL
jgi:hypothetical protein